MPVGLPDLKSDITNSLMGQVSEIAQIIITDYRALRDAPPENNKQNAANNTENANAGALDALNDAPPGAGAVVRIPEPPKMPGSALDLETTSKKRGLAIRKLTFEVQFNPSELSLNASALAINKQSVAVNKKTGSSKSSGDPSGAAINLNVNLIFDKMNETDAFQMETGTLGAAGLVTAGLTASALSKGQQFSVRPEVEMLMAALRDEYTREAEFHWNDFSFVGTLQFVQVRYTMFSPAGHPVRATVAIRMKREATVGDQWEKDFDAVFSGAGGQVSSVSQQHNYLNM